MSLKGTDVKELANHDHEVLGADFCSGYTDIYGKWNTGFDCPRMGNGKTVYCCGTNTDKYCCTRRDQHSGPGISQSVLLGSALGSVMVIIIVTFISCLICRRCVPYRRQHPSLNGGPLYTMHCSSAGSGMTNMYSFSGQPSAVTTPLDAPHVLVDLEASEHTYTMPLNSERGLARHLVAGGVTCQTPTDPPPSYTEANASASGINIIEGSSPTSNSFDLRTSRVMSTSSQHRHPSTHRRQPLGCNAATTQNTLYWSTKF